MICIDTDCLIDFFKGKKNALTIIKKYHSELVTTSINEFEIFFGIFHSAYKGELSSARDFFTEIGVFSFGDCSEKAAKVMSNLIKSGKVIEQNDCFIAAIMINNGVKKIITNNQKHFSRIPGIEVINY